MERCCSGVFLFDSLSVFSTAKRRISFCPLTSVLRWEGCRVTLDFRFLIKQRWKVTGGSPQAESCALSFPWVVVPLLLEACQQL